LPEDYLLSNACVWVNEYLDVFDVSVECVEVLWNRRFRTTVAMAQFSDERIAIELSERIYTQLLPMQRVEVVAHETCHIASWLAHGMEIDHHGEEWKAMMRHLGFSNPTTHMSVGLKPKEGIWPRRICKMRESGSRKGG
jgi:predicted SprT family Zn-dependent metalloprotease